MNFIENYPVSLLGYTVQEYISLIDKYSDDSNESSFPISELNYLFSPSYQLIEVINNQKFFRVHEPFLLVSSEIFSLKEFQEKKTDLEQKLIDDFKQKNISPISLFFQPLFLGKEAVLINIFYVTDKEDNKQTFNWLNSNRKHIKNTFSNF